MATERWPGSGGEPLVSVVIPTFNRPDYLRIALASVLDQSHRSLDIIIHDNASTADPLGIVEAFGDSRIRYFRNETTISQTANVISGCARAVGKYVAILGDDDVWHPEFLRALVAPLEADEDLTIAFCDHEIIDAAGVTDRAATERVRRSFQRHQLREGTHRPFDEIALVFRSICVFSAAVLRRRDIDWQAVPLELGFGPVDHYLAYLAARTGKGCYYVPRRLAQYRYHALALGSSLARPDQKLASARYAMVYWAKLADDRTLTRSRRYFEMKRAFNALRIVTALWRCGDWREAAGQLRHYWHDGLIRPRSFLDHLAYAIKLRRVRA